MKRIALLFFLLWVSIGIQSTMAHSGNTDRFGCHTNHSTGEYHCHEPKQDLTPIELKAQQLYKTDLSTKEQAFIYDLVHEKSIGYQARQVIDFNTILEKREEEAIKSERWKWIKGIGMTLIFICIIQAIRYRK